MLDPISEFTELYRSTTDLSKRERLKREFAAQALTSFGPESSRTILTRLGTVLGEDMTSFFPPSPAATPLSDEEQQAAIETAKGRATPFRRALNKVVEPFAWWQKNVTEPTAAIALGVAFNLIPGEQEFEKNLVQVRTARAQREAVEGATSYFKGFTVDSAAAYRQTKLPWGLKGVSEFIFDPLILVGWGIPGAVSRALPATLRPLLVPLRAIDAAPNVVANKTLAAMISGVLPRPIPPAILRATPTMPATVSAIESFAQAVPIPLLTRGAKDIPVIHRLTQPSVAAQANQAMKESFGAVASTFGERFSSTLPQVTEEVLSDLTTFPKDLPMRTVLDHIGASFDSDDAFQAWLTGIKEHDPASAAYLIGDKMRTLEEAAIRKGGVRLGGAEVAGISERRVAEVTSFLQKVAIREEQAAWVARNVDSVIQGLEDVAVRKIEPWITRPWALANLSFAGYIVGNFIDDVAHNILGLGVHPFGVPDELGRLLQGHLPIDQTLPTNLLGAKATIVNSIDTGAGLYKTPPVRTPTQAFADRVATWTATKAAGRMSPAIQWNSWHKDLLKNAHNLAAAKIPADQFNELKALLKSELPADLGHIHKALVFNLMGAMATGNPKAVRTAGEFLTSEHMLLRTQRSIISKFPELGPDVRRTFMTAINRAGGVTPANLDTVMREAIDETLRHMEYLPSGIHAAFDDFLLGLATDPIRSPEEALGTLRLLASARESINNLPHEITALAAHRANLTRDFAEREKIWEEALIIKSGTVGEIRKLYEDAVEQSWPQIEKQVLEIVKHPRTQVTAKKHLSDIRTLSLQSSKSLQSTWDNYRLSVEAHFTKTPRGQRDEAFWTAFRSIGMNIWDAHRIDRAVLARQQHDAWMGLFDSIPRSLTPKGRFMAERALWSAYDEVDERLNLLRVDRADIEERLVTAAPDHQADLTRQLGNLDESILSTKVQRDKLIEQIGTVVPGRKSMPRAIYDEHTENIHILDRELALATERKMPTEDIITQRQKLIDERDEYLDSIVPPALRERWEAVKNNEVKRGRFVLRLFEDVQGQAVRSTRETLNRMARVLTDEGVAPNINDINDSIIRLADEGQPDAELLVASRNKIQLPVAPERTLTLVHYSKLPGLTELDPKFYGTGIPDAAARRKASAVPGQWIDRTYYYVADTAPEPKVARGAVQRYTVEMPANRIYDATADPEGIIAAARSGLRGDDAVTAWEKAVADAGYAGVSVRTRGGFETVQLFEAAPVLGAAPISQVMSPDTAAAIVKTVQDTGGASFSLDGVDIVAEAEAGRAGRFLVGVHPDRTQTLTTLTDADVLAFAAANRDRLSLPGRFVGVGPKTGGGFELDVSMSVADRAEAMALAADKNQREIFDAIAKDVLPVERPTAVPLVTATPQEVNERILSSMLDLADRPALSEAAYQVLRQADNGDLVISRTLSTLAKEGYITFRPAAGGHWHTTLTDKGRVELAGRPAVDVSSVLADLPPAVKAHQTATDEMMDKLTALGDELVESTRNPPITAAQEVGVRRFADKIARFMEERPNLQEAYRTSFAEAAKATNDDFRRFSLLYDMPSNGDYLMQRIMPYWTFESRRWPRLIQLAAKKPIFTKYAAAAVYDERFGRVPGPWGVEFNPMRLTMAVTLRAAGRRDYPELYHGYRGAIEEATDWMGRFGFFVKPEIMAVRDIMFDEPAAMMPPPATLLLHGLLATPGLDQVVPDQIQRLALNDRYIEFSINEALADLFPDTTPTILRRNAAGPRGLPDTVDAQAKLDMARREALRRTVLANQFSIGNYRPQTRRDYVVGGMEAVSTYTGLSLETIEKLRRLGVPYDEAVVVSELQRRAIREATPNYKSQIGVALALRPKDQQEAYWLRDEFFEAVEKMRTVNFLERQKVSAAWERNDIDGPTARRMLSELNQDRASAFEELHNTPRYKTVAIGMAERQAEAVRFGYPPKMVSPVDEAMEQYFGITPDAFTDPMTLEMDWDGFYRQREQALAAWPSPVQESVREELNRSETTLEKALKQHAPALRRYWGVRGVTMRQLSPDAVAAQKIYNRLSNLAALQTDFQLASKYRLEALRVLSQHPDVVLAEAQTRFFRQQLRFRDKEVADAYRLFIRRV